MDDHDFGPNDSDSTSPSRVASLATYRRRVPFPSLPFTGATEPFCHSFVQGRIRYIMTDGRSQRDTNGIFGPTQMAWIKSQIDAAAAAGQFIIMCHGSTVIGAGLGAGSASDYGVPNTHSLSAKQLERADLYEYLKTKGMGRKTLFLAGDAHRLQCDDGSSWDYSTTGPALGGTKIPNVHSGGIYTGGAGVATGTYWSDGVVDHSAAIQCMAGICDVVDGGGSTIALNFTFYGTDNTSTAENVIKTVSYTLGTPAPALPSGAIQATTACYTSTFLGSWNCTFGNPATAGRHIILVVACRGTFPAGGYTTTGWTQIAATTDDADVTVRVYRRTAVGGETTLGVSSTIGGRAVSLAMFEIDANAATPLDVSNIDAQHNNTAATGVTLSATTTVDNCLALAIHSQGNGSTIGPRNWTKGFQEVWHDPNPGPSLQIAMKSIATAGAVSTALTYGEANARTGLLLCFRPV